ncbi:holo-ACP synthase [Stenomitos frigidus]|uniref:holo-ACP synthase n=1 Tax=Stenomitos frigidus TaxID=1886765 RepID=UPI0011B29F81|nr:hypothetical protein [Stenomitos frigidus]
MLVIKSVIQAIVDINRTLLLSDVEYFSSYERSYCLSKTNPLASFAGILCAKAAFMSAIAHSAHPDCTFADVEVRHSATGRPWIGLVGPLAQWCQEQRLAIDTSISHSGEFAAATVLLYSTQQKGHLQQLP